MRRLWSLGTNVASDLRRELSGSCRTKCTHDGLSRVRGPFTAKYDVPSSIRYLDRLALLAALGSERNACSSIPAAGVSRTLPVLLVRSWAPTWSASRGVTALKTQGSCARRWAMERKAAWFWGVKKLSTVVPGFVVNRIAIGSPPKTFS